MMNEPTYTTSPQELIIKYKINSEEDSIILAFTYRSPNSRNENYENYNNTILIVFLIIFHPIFLLLVILITQKLNGTIIPLKAMT